MAVGRSSRTPFKHWLLNSELGRIAGVLSTGKAWAMADPFLVMDLCAGDGLSNDDHTCSPDIILKHCRALHGRKPGVRAAAVFIERSEHTFGELAGNLPQDDPFDVVAWHADARDIVIQPSRPRQAIFVHADPNSLADWPLSDQLLDSVTETTTLLATLGCNVGGLKRLPREERQQWFEHVSAIEKRLPRWHDLILVKLLGDKAQWAYLLQTPIGKATRWVPRICSAIDRIRKRVESGDEAMTLPGPPVYATYRGSRSDYEQMKRELFLTRQEIGGAA